MKHCIAFGIFIFAVLILPSKCDLKCDEEVLPSLSEIGPKVASAEESNENFGELIKKWSCSLKKKAKEIAQKVKENAEKLNENAKEGVKKFAITAKEVGAKWKTKFHDLKERLHKDSDEVADADKKFFLENVEIINPDILRTDQECGHGHILDLLGNCKKLRK